MRGPVAPRRGGAARRGSGRRGTRTGGTGSGGWTGPSRCTSGGAGPSAARAECADAFVLKHDACLRELVNARCTQLRLWLEDPATKLARKHRKPRKDAKDSLRDIVEL
jgi:hypothetical protein